MTCRYVRMFTLVKTKINLFFVYRGDNKPFYQKDRKSTRDPSTQSPAQRGELIHPTVSLCLAS